MQNEQKRKIVVLGGGTGMPVLLRGLKKYDIDLTAIVTVADDGGSTGRLREVMHIPAPGDIRNTIIALSNADPEMVKLFQYRFNENEHLSGHALGNIILAAMGQMTGDFYTGIKKICELFRVRGNIYPVVTEPVTLNAVLEDGSIVSGEKNIPSADKKISRIYLTPNDVKPMKQVVRAILEADLVVISPGSLYTSIMPNLVVSEVAEALRNCTATILYVCNVMTQHGETNDYSVLDHIKAITKHVGTNIVDAVIVNNNPIDKDVAKRYEAEKASPVLYNKEMLLEYGLSVLEDDIVEYSKGTIRHNTEKIAEMIYDIVRQDHVNEEV